VKFFKKLIEDLNTSEVSVLHKYEIINKWLKNFDIRPNHRGCILHGRGAV